MTYMTKSWKICRVRDLGPLEDGFGKHLRECSRPSQICFVQIMTRHKGSPCGVEFRHYKDVNRWAFVLPDASQPGYRMQYFDDRGFSGHAHFKDIESAVDEMVSMGYRLEDAGALDRLSITPKWIEGLAWLEQVQNHNSQLKRAA